MNAIYTWGADWGVPLPALQDLLRRFGMDSPEPGPLEGRSEAAVQNRVRLQVSQQGGRSWRNNVGAYIDDHGNHVRYGLCNDSAKLNKVLKSSDLIGIAPTTVTWDMVGTTVGIFEGIECKEPGWTYTGTDREKAQLAFGTLVLSLGGRWRFENGSGLV